MIYQSRYRIVSVVLVHFLFISNLLFAQDENTTNPLDIKVVSFPQGQSNPSSQKLVADYLREAIRLSEFLVLSDDSPLEIMVTTQDDPERNEVIISLVRALAMPKEVVKLASENEVFYKVIKMEQDEMPSEGKFIREYITTEVISRFKDIQRNEIIRVRKDQIEIACTNYIGRLANRYAKIRISRKQ